MFKCDERYKINDNKKKLLWSKIEVKDAYFLRYVNILNRLQDLHKMFNSVKTNKN